MAEINIEVDEFISCCSSWEKRELADALKESGYLDDEDDRDPYPLDTNGRGYDAYEFEEALKKLAQNYHSLPKEQTDIIINLAKRF